MKVLHVLTLLDDNGRYGGPVKVAREIKKGLIQRNISVKIFGGSLSRSTVISRTGEESFFGRSLLKKIEISSFWSNKLASKIISEIRQVDFVHIHFARDLVSYFTAIACLVYRKPFLAQTHGMVVQDKRPMVLLIDNLITKPILGKARKVLLLSKKEETEFIELKSNTKFAIVPNGINVPIESNFSQRQKLVLYCGRIHEQKRVNRIVQIAEQIKEPEWVFEIIGPDGGYLEQLLHQIGKTPKNTQVRYLGSFTNSELQTKLSKCAVLILPSYNEQFPMIILEALSLGTPVIVAPSCGIADTLQKFNTHFVPKGDDLADFVNCTKYWMTNTPSYSQQQDISDFCKRSFGIVEVSGAISNIYESNCHL